MRWKWLSRRAPFRELYAHLARLQRLIETRTRGVATRESLRVVHDDLQRQHEALAQAQRQSDQALQRLEAGQQTLLRQLQERLATHEATLATLQQSLAQQQAQQRATVQALDARLKALAETSRQSAAALRERLQPLDVRTIRLKRRLDAEAEATQTLATALEDAQTQHTSLQNSLGQLRKRVQGNQHRLAQPLRQLQQLWSAEGARRAPSELPQPLPAPSVCIDTETAFWRDSVTALGLPEDTADALARDGLCLPPQRERPLLHRSIPHALYWLEGYRQWRLLSGWLEDWGARPSRVLFLESETGFLARHALCQSHAQVHCGLARAAETAWMSMHLPALEPFALSEAPGALPFADHSLPLVVLPRLNLPPVHWQALWLELSRVLAPRGHLLVGIYLSESLKRIRGPEALQGGLEVTWLRRRFRQSTNVRIDSPTALAQRWVLTLDGPQRLGLQEASLVALSASLSGCFQRLRLCSDPGSGLSYLLLSPITHR